MKPHFPAQRGWNRNSVVGKKHRHPEAGRGILCARNFHRDRKFPFGFARGKPHSVRNDNRNFLIALSKISPVMDWHVHLFVSSFLSDGSRQLRSGKVRSMLDPNVDGSRENSGENIRMVPGGSQGVFDEGNAVGTCFQHRFPLLGHQVDEKRVFS
uniref:Uncharacterized protein n=1 Tax=Candidatus Kentrum sp. FW TaxID=2126338 RepID=A0A450TY88_9GAMM|nr:MAG: hypothetical protein BECKFW1821C_GA0114237_106123 [Candidatus Kentron sp. FW]